MSEEEIKCPHCAELVKAEATKCKHCGSKIKKSKQYGSLSLPGCLGMLFLFFVIGTCAPDHSPPATSARQGTPPKRTESAPAPAPEKDKLLLTTWSWSEESGYITVEGEVKNISGESMDRVQPVATFTKDDGTFVKSETGVLSYSPLLPNQTSPFKVMCQSNPAITKAKVGFKEIFGTQIPTKYK